MQVWVLPYWCSYVNKDQGIYTVKLKVARNEKWKKLCGVFLFYKYGKFWSVLPKQKVEHKPLFSEEWRPWGRGLLQCQDFELAAWKTCHSPLRYSLHQHTTPCPQNTWTNNNLAPASSSMIKEHFIPMGRLHDSLWWVSNPFFRSQPVLLRSKLKLSFCVCSGWWLLLCWSLLNLDSLFEKKSCKRIEKPLLW